MMKARMLEEENKVLRELVKAAHEELVFTFRHPMAVERGEVWTERSRVGRLYKALRKWRKLAKMEGGE